MDRIREYLNFDVLIAPTLIKVLYVLSAIGAVIVAIWYIVEEGYFEATLASIGILVAGEIVLRLLFEATMIIFKIHAQLKDANKSLKTLNEKQ